MKRRVQKYRSTRISYQIPERTLLIVRIRKILNPISVFLNPKMEGSNLGSTKYTCNSVSSLGNHSTIYTGLIVDAVLDSAILRGKLTELVGLWPILGGDLIKDVSLFYRYYSLLISSSRQNHGPSPVVLLSITPVGLLMNHWLATFQSATTSIAMSQAS